MATSHIYEVINSISEWTGQGGKVGCKYAHLMHHLRQRCNSVTFCGVGALASMRLVTHRPSTGWSLAYGNRVNHPTPQTASCTLTLVIYIFKSKDSNLNRFHALS